MKIAIIIFVVLLIVAAIAFVVFRKMQLQNEHDSISDGSGIDPKERLKGVMGGSRSHDEPHRSEPTHNINPLATAEAHLSNQNYPEAISALKNILMTNPRHQGAMLKLLQVYGLTKQYDAFNQLHQKIHEIGDGEAIREADFCKSLLDEEAKAEQQAQALHSAANKAPAPTIDTLEFDIEPETTSQPARKVVSTANDSQEELLDLDFDVSSNKATTASDDELLEFDDFNFDEPKAESKPVQDNSLNLDADFNFDPTPA
uniref:type IV pilus assembly protein FimV n=1 Tax=Moraxella oblonga TaxID=200413 RepID=UPI000A62C28C